VTSGPAAKPGAGALGDSASVPGAAPVRRLTRLEYDNSIKDLLGVSMSISKDAQLGDAESGNAGFVRGGSITGGDDARNVMNASAALSESLVPRLGSFLPCAPIPTATAEQDACAAKFITQFGKRAYRRPLTQRETEMAKGLYDAQRGPEVGASFEKAITTLIGAFIQSPQFLYHWELGGNPPSRMEPSSATTATRSPLGCPTSSGPPCPMTSCSRPPTPTPSRRRSRSLCRPAGCSATSAPARD